MNTDNQLTRRRAQSAFFVDLAAIKSNLEIIKSFNKTEIIFMIKANAYGHGIREVSNYLQQNKTVSHFGVASVNELVDIDILDNMSYWVFSEIDLENNIELYKKNNIYAVLSNLEDLSFFISNISKENIVLKFNTGMNRLGFRLSDLEIVFNLLKKNNINTIYHIMTHFSSSSLKIDKISSTIKQYEEFREIKRLFEDRNIHFAGSSCANSGAIEQNFGTLQETHIRPGLMGYGPLSFKSLENIYKDKLKIASSLKSKILTKTSYKKGDRIGYGQTELPYDAWIANIPLGYGDGLLNYYTNAKVFCGDLEGFIFGRVNMDICSIIFSQYPVDDFVIIWDQNLSEFSNQVNAIPYQVLTTISNRVPKIYKS